MNQYDYREGDKAQELEHVRCGGGKENKRKELVKGEEKVEDNPASERNRKRTKLPWDIAK